MSWVLLNLYDCYNQKNEVDIQAIQAAISAAFKTPEVVALFVNKQPAALREKLVAVGNL